MNRCSEGLRLWSIWHNTASNVLAIYSAAGLTGKELIQAQEDNGLYKAAFQDYSAHIKTCADCQKYIRWLAG